MNFNVAYGDIATVARKAIKFIGPAKGRVIAGSLAGAGVGSVAGGEDHRISGGIAGGLAGAVGGFGMGRRGKVWARGAWSAATAEKGIFNPGTAGTYLKNRISRRWGGL